MLGHHEGITPLDDTSTIIKPAVIAMAHLKVGKSVPERKKVLVRAAAQISPEDRYWPETLASRLTEAGIEAAPAHLVALKVAADLREVEVADLFRSVNGQDRDEYTSRVVHGMNAADTKFGERLRAGRIDSDEVFIRVAFSHFFRRDPDSVFQIFMVDAAVRRLSRIWNGGVQSFVRWALHRFNKDDVPQDAWGYIVVLREMTSRGGYYLREPTEETRKLLRNMEEVLQPSMPDASEQQVLHAIAASSYLSNYLKGDFVGFTVIMAAIQERLGAPFAVMYARPDEGGVHTDIRAIPATSVDEARRVVGKMPEVVMHDDFRRLTEFLAQEQDMAERVPDA